MKSRWLTAMMAQSNELLQSLVVEMRDEACDLFYRARLGLIGSRDLTA
jgi:hypothetical protein